MQLKIGSSKYVFHLFCLSQNDFLRMQEKAAILGHYSVETRTNIGQQNCSAASATFETHLS